MTDAIKQYMSEKGITLDVAGVAFHAEYEPWRLDNVFEYVIIAKHGGHEFKMPWLRGYGLEVRDWNEPGKPRWDACRKRLNKAYMHVSEHDQKKLKAGKVVWWEDPAVQEMIRLSIENPPASEAPDMFIQHASDCFRALEYTFDDWAPDNGFSGDSLKAHHIWIGLRDDASSLLGGGFIDFGDVQTIYDMAAEL